jgi:hypothetical protein
VLQVSPSYLAVLYHPSNTWWPIPNMNLITYSAIYDHRTILPASCYFTFSGPNTTLTHDSHTITTVPHVGPACLVPYRAAGPA